MTAEEIAGRLTKIEARTVCAVGLAGERGHWIHSHANGFNWVAAALIHRRGWDLFVGVPGTMNHIQLTGLGRDVYDLIPTEEEALCPTAST